MMKSAMGPDSLRAVLEIARIVIIEMRKQGIAVSMKPPIGEYFTLDEATVRH